MAVRFAFASRCQGSHAAHTVKHLISLPSRSCHPRSIKQLLDSASPAHLLQQKVTGFSLSRSTVVTRAVFDDAPPVAEENCKVFVGNLPWSVTVQELGDFFFDACGPVADVFIPVDKNTGRPKGIGFVEFENASSASQAVASLSGADLGGRSIVVDYAGKPSTRAPRNNFADMSSEPVEPSNRVFVAKLSYDTTWEDLKDFFKQCGNVTFARISTQPDGSSKGCGLVQFETIEEAQGAIQELNGAELDGFNIVVRADRPKPAGDRRAPREDRGGRGFGNRDEMRSSRGGRDNERRTYEKKPGDWTCPSCGANVFASKDTCYRCSEPKPAGAGGEW